MSDGQPHDKPLSFHWRAPDFDVRELGLSEPKSRKHALALQSVIHDLMLEALSTDRFVSYSRRHTWYSDTRRYRGSAYTYASVLAAVADLERAGLIEHWKAAPQPPGRALAKGEPFAASDLANHEMQRLARQLGIAWKAPAEPAGGRQSTMRAKDALVVAVAPTTLVHKVSETVRLRDSDKRLVGYRDTNQTLQWRKSLVEINEAIRSLSLALPGAELVAFDGLRVPTKDGKQITVQRQRDQLFRIFNEDWRHGGRLYGGWWQQLPKEWRQRLLIDGCNVAEPDYSSHHPRILYALHGERLVGDPYEVAGFDRPLAKVALNVILNARTAGAALYAVAREVERIERCVPNYDGLIGQASLATSRALIGALKGRHPKIARHFASGIGNYLQYLDSQMADRIVRTLMRRHGIAVLPVHDSFVVAERHCGQVREAMDKAFDAVIARAA